MKRLHLDGLMTLYSLLIVGCFVVSAPATFSLVGLYHNDGTRWGLAATVALLLILEVGAVAAKVATLWLDEGRDILDAAVWAALGVNGLSNLIHGYQVGAANGLTGLVLWAGAIVYALSVPALLAVLLWLLVQRVEALRARHTTAQERAELVLRPVQDALAMQQALLGLMREAYPALPEPQQQYARPSLTDANERPGEKGCAVCGEPWQSNGHKGSIARWGCKACGAGPDRALGRVEGHL